VNGSISLLGSYAGIERFRRRPDPIKPEDVVLASYTFLPYVRTGAAAVLDQPFDWTLPARATCTLSVPVVADAGTVFSEVTVRVRGPGDVVAIDPAQVIRCYPRPGSTDALTEDLAHVEFDRPDFPWLFTPTGPTPDHRLVPWITLVVVPILPDQASPVVPGQRGRLPQLHTKRRELPMLADAWAWAHAQVMGPKEAPESIAERLSPVNPVINLSRLLCPRRLEPDTSYVACVVPTFRAGVEAGKGATVTTTTLERAWADEAPDDSDVVLPVYYSFGFATGQRDDFKALAERLEPRAAPPGVGRRRLDVSRPGSGIPPVPVDPGRVLVVEGPVVSLEPAGGAGEEQWPAAQHDALVERLNAAQDQRYERAPQPHPTVGPPLYAGAHVARTALNAAAPGWFTELNSDPRNRVVAGLGTRVVQADQEAMMAEAWNQVVGVQAANAALRFAQLGRHVAASIHRRHIVQLKAPALLAVTSGVHSRIRRAGGLGLTIRAEVAASSLPEGVTSGAFRRLVRPRGPVARFAAASLADRPTRLGALTCDTAQVTKSYVRPYRNPDGIDAISQITRNLIGPGLVSHAWGFAGDHRTILEERARMLALASVTDALVGSSLDRLDMQAQLRPATAPAAVLRQLLLALPHPDLIETDREAAEVTHTLARLIASVAAQADHFVLPTPVVERVRLVARTTQHEQLEYVDWISLTGGDTARVATGTLSGTTVTLSGVRFGHGLPGGIQDEPGSRLDGTEVFLARAGFDPPLPLSDLISIVAPGIAPGDDPMEPTTDPNASFLLRFSRPVTDPILYLGSVASVLRFPTGTRIDKLSGEEEFTVDGSIVRRRSIEAPVDLQANGVVQLRGAFTSIPFTAVTAGLLDGIYFHVAVRTTVLSVVDRLGVGELVDRLGALTAPHQLGDSFDDPHAADQLGRLVSEWQQPAPVVDDLKRLASRLVSPDGVTEPDRGRIHVPDLRLPALLDPKETVHRRVLGRLTSRPSWLRPDWFDDRRVEPVMTAPAFDHPMYEALDRYDRNWLIPGVAAMPEADLVTALQTNGRFVEAFLVGLNDAFARELLWRGYPTDGRGTSFRSFWTRQAELIEDLHAFRDVPLGQHIDPGISGRLVLLARGELIRRYPGLTAHAVQHSRLEGGRPVFGDAAVTARTIFQINLQPDLLLVGFDLTRAQVDAEDVTPDAAIPDSGAWWFTLAENPTEPRFGLDEGVAVTNPRDDITWAALLPVGQRFLPLSPPLAIVDGPPPPTPSSLTPVIWGADAAAVAHILYNPPSRAAFRAARLVGKASP
jgi:hypothetical protein